MKQMNLNEAFREYLAMKKILCIPWQKNKFLPLENRLFWFIGVHLVHLRRQLSGLPAFPMNQMNLDVVICCLWHEICFRSLQGGRRDEPGNVQVHRGSLKETE